MTALRKILVVDDDPVVGTSFNRVLSRKGYSVITAHDAAEALEELRREEVDLVFTDIKMPGMDGLQLAEKLKGRRPWTPVVIITGYGTAADEQRAKEAGVDAFLHKPLTPEAIEETTEQVMHLPPAAEPEVSVEPAKRESRLKNVALFIAAPFIGLVYAVFLPFVGLGLTAWMLSKKLMAHAGVRRVMVGTGKVLATVFAPLIGLAYVIVLPFAGLATLIYMTGRKVWAGHAAE
jgi:CheY-like chemotaxis protein